MVFVHPERFEGKDWAHPGFAAFLSSVIETGVDRREMDGIRGRLQEIGLEPYYCLSPALMDYIATWTVEHRAKSSTKAAAEPAEV